MSGLIFVAVALGWAGYLIPRAMLRADDRALAAPVIAAAEQGTSARVLPRTSSLTREAVAASAPVLNPAQRRALRIFRREARLAARRRAMVLSFLMVAVLAVAVLAAVDVLAGWWTVVPVVLAAVWLITCRAAVRRAAAETERRVAGLAVLAPPAPAADVAAPARRPLADSAVAPAVSAAAVAITRVVPDSELEDTGPLWQPLQVPLPLYVSAPPAPRRTVRAIDLAGAGVTSSGHDAADSELARQASAEAAPSPAEELAAQVRRAG